MNLSPITTEEARAELLQINRGTLRALHNMNRIDWNKPHAILKLYPPFTRQTIRKAAAAAGYPAALALVLLHDTKPRFECDRRRLTVFEIDPAGGLETTNEMHHNSNPGNALDSAYSKGQFDEIRKRPSAAGYVILQNDEDHAPRKARAESPDPWTRYTAARRHCNYYNHVIWDLYPVKGQQTTPAATVDGGWIKASEKPESPLDSGGYFNADQLKNRRRLAEVIKAEREKAAYLLQETAADVETVTAAADELRRHVAELLQDQDLTRAAVAASAAYIYGLYISSAIERAARFQARSAGHEYGSAAKAANARDKALEEISTAREKFDTYIAEKTGKEEKSA